MSETTACREILLTWCRGGGLDLGAGGDPIRPDCVSIDLPNPYTRVGDSPINLKGDARNLYWFKDNVLDYVFSSHLLEDFPPTSTILILKEWLRVIKEGGFLVLYLPDEQQYRQFCKDQGIARNVHHLNEELSLEWMISTMVPLLPVKVVFTFLKPYSFGIVLQKT